MSYKLTRYEQEVVITFNAEEDIADIYTADPVYIRKMDKLVEQNPEMFRKIREEKLDGKVVAKRYEFPKRLITIRSKVKSMNMTDEQRAESAERLKVAREMKSTAQN